MFSKPFVIFLLSLFHKNAMLKGIKSLECPLQRWRTHHRLSLSLPSHSLRKEQSEQVWAPEADRGSSSNRILRSQ